ncbi:urea transporter [Colwellia psychrerythraea]|uniref:protein acetyllysine N-acetyltransferase n=1 Tax=Colwellia psychrerythraea TaxID=28229 RepID=A0A099KHU3_COLPS|nr:urea transporter [Colwellia psychrerythraea]KGJ89552.1 Urea transporter [Colwellia psychrerythraea]
MINVNFKNHFTVQWRSFAQLAFLDRQTSGLLIFLAIGFVSVWSAFAAIIAVIINNSLSLIIKDYTLQEWRLGIAGYNGAIIGMYWGDSILSIKGLCLFLITLLVCLFLECRLRALLIPRQLPILSLPAMVSILFIVLTISIFSLDPNYLFFTGKAVPILQTYSREVAIILVVSAMAYQYPLATLQTLGISLVGGLIAQWFTGLNFYALVDLWAINLPLAYFSIKTLFLKHSSLSTLAATMNTLLAGCIWFFWFITGLEQLSAPLLFPFILSSLITLIFFRRYKDHNLLQSELWRTFQLLLFNRLRAKHCVAITGSGIRKGALPDYPSGQWLDPKVPITSYTLAEFKASKRCRYLYWKASYDYYQQALTMNKNNIDKQLDSLLNYYLSGLFTETVDSLLTNEQHPIYECYGSIKNLYCLDCAQQQAWPPVPLWLQRDLHCQHCSGLLKPQILAADENIDPECYQALQTNMANCGSLLVIGVPAVTPVVSMIIENANANKIPIIFIGTLPSTYLLEAKDIQLTGDIANWLTYINWFTNILHPLKWYCKWKK